MLLQAAVMLQKSSVSFSALSGGLIRRFGFTGWLLAALLELSCSGCRHRAFFSAPCRAACSATVSPAATLYTSKMKRSVLAAALVLGVVLAGCLPIPNLHADLKLPTAPQRLEPRRVSTQYVSLPGENTVGTPRRLNRTFYLRYYTPEADREDPDTILILMPGIFGGAASFDILARQLVVSRARLEVWAVDRRANALEDRSALVKSLRTHNPSVAYRYYGEDAGTPAGFNAVSADDAGFMRRWGLVTHLRDLHAVVEKANAKAETVVLGGHSLGASIVSFYAAYRFADGLGDAQLDGLLLLDGTLGRTGAFGLTAGLTLGNLELIPDAAGYEAGRGPPFLAFGVGPGFYAQQESRALLARFRPNQLAPDTLVSHN